MPVLELKGISKNFGGITALSDVSLKIEAGEVIGLMGDNGAGKSTLAKITAGNFQPSTGEIILDGENVRFNRPIDARNRGIEIVYQDLALCDNISAACNVFMGRELVRKIGPFNFLDFKAMNRRAGELFAELKSETRPKDLVRLMSGGQRQRVGIARALAMNPEFIICDEAVSALDVSIQAQDINLLEDLREEFGLTYLFISHDLSVIRHICHRVAVMYLGNMVELADCDELYDNPMHPYTQALLEAVPIPDPDLEKARAHKIVKGEIPSPMNPPTGCVFHPRCEKAVASCSQNVPEFREVKPGHWVACTEV